MNKFLEIENDKYYGFAIGPEGSIVYYVNQKDKQNMQQTDAYGELFLVKYPITEWKLSNEKKIIGKYTCYKAKAIITSNGSKGKIESPVTVWYAPEIPIHFGPLGFSGLPGLIIELEINKIKYYVNKIELNPAIKISIQKPTHGHEVSKEEFDRIGIGAMESFKKGY